MNTKLMAMLLGVLFAVPALADTVGVRAWNEQARIGAGVRDGSLNPREAARLERREGHLRRELLRDRVSGGGLSAPERLRLERQENRLSRSIYRDRHNCR